MEQQFVTPTTGIEVEDVDFDLVSKNAAQADDRVFAELLRMMPAGSPVARGILPSSSYQGVSQSAVVTARATADARVIINPFRAFIAAISPVTTRDAYHDIRSGLFVATGAGSDPIFQTFQLLAATNNRWDLVYARVDVDVADAGVTRYVKDTSDNVTSEVISNTQSTTVTIGVVQGTEATTPAKPAVPADSGSSFYIPLAYVMLKAGHTLTSTIPVNQIDEIAPVLSLSRATGASTMRVANGINKEGGISKVNTPWTPTANRAPAYLPATMVGEEKLLLPLRLTGSHPTIVLNNQGVVDDSIDWRNRVFRVHVRFVHADSQPSFPWIDPALGTSEALLYGAVPVGWNPSTGFSTLLNDLEFCSQSFANDYGGGSPKSILARLNNVTTNGTLPVGALVELVVNLDDGKLYVVQPNTTDSGADFLFFIEASGQFNNAY